jgi:cyclic pyranopterin phosphate synthase
MSRGGELTHLDAVGRAQMVDVGEKAVTERVCVARGEVRMAPETLDRVMAGEVPKGDVLATARLAGIQAAKRTHEWIPLAHQIPLDSVEVHFQPRREVQPDGRVALAVEGVARAHAKTGVEMEALVAVSAAGLTIYDMCKAADRGMTLEAVRLAQKQGGKSGVWERPGEPGAQGPRPGE